MSLSSFFLFIILYYSHRRKTNDTRIYQNNMSFSSGQAKFLIDSQRKRHPATTIEKTHNRQICSFIRIMTLFDERQSEKKTKY